MPRTPAPPRVVAANRNAVITPPPPDPEPPDPEEAEPGTAVLDVDWGTTTGTSNNAISDGNLLDDIRCSGTSVASVIAGAGVGWTRTTNVLQITRKGYDGSGYPCKQMEVSPIPDVSALQNYYVRCHIRNDATGSDGQNPANHPFCINNFGDTQAQLWAPWRGASSPSTHYRAKMSATYASTNVNGDRRWQPPELPLGDWFCFEWLVQFTGLVGGYHTYALHPRVWNDDDELIYTGDDYTRVTGFGGDPDQTLYEWYNEGGRFVFSDVSLSRNLGLGYEGPATSTDTNEKWYYAALGVATDGFLLPYGM